MVDRVIENLDKIKAICQRHGVLQLDLFGSAARDDFDASTSDVDFFYEFDPRVETSVADRFFGLWEDLESALGRPVDLVSARDATNPYFLQVANLHRVTIYAAAADAKIPA